MRKKCLIFLKRAKLSYEYSGKVNAQSLSALVRKQLEDGLEVPEDIIKVSRTVEVKLNEGK